MSNLQPFTIRRLMVQDRAAVEAVLLTRENGKSRVMLGATLLSDTSLPKMLKGPEIYLQSRVFGVFRDGKLTQFSVLRPNNAWSYYFIMQVSALTREPKPIVNGYNTDTQALIDHGVQAMEQEGFTTAFSITPAKHWAATQDNPNRTEPLRYVMSVIEEVPAGALPKSQIGKGIMQQPHVRDVLVTQYKLRHDQ